VVDIGHLAPRFGEANSFPFRDIHFGNPFALIAGGGGRKIMKTKLLALFLLAGSSLFAAHFSVGIGIGVGGYYPYRGYYVAPPPVAYAPPPAYYAAPGYSWVDGYYYPVGARRVWRPGYWARPPYAGAVWIRPRWEGRRYYEGRWRRR
jgi:hypothetical protein